MTHTSFAVSSDEWCCGSIALRTGDLALANELAQHNAQLFKQMSARTLVTNCAGCYRTLKLEYPSLVEGYDLEVLHATEWLNTLVQKGRLSFKALKGTATYHDPCHLGRHSRVYDAPRALLHAIPRLNLVEMKRNRDHAWCCGAGGGVKSAFPDLALKIGNDRIREALDTGAQYLVSACPFCKTNLQDAASASGAQLQVVDILELLAETAK
jgi:heterodisulfide reductase subunit D